MQSSKKNKAYRLSVKVPTGKEIFRALLTFGKFVWGEEASDISLEDMTGDTRNTAIKEGDTLVKSTCNHQKRTKPTGCQLRGI
jgi:hypothetical protein